MSSFVKKDSGKLRYDLVPPKVVESLARVLTFGASKYAPNNWAKCEKRSRYIAALDRHLNAWKAGEDVDPETGDTHLAHALCCLAFLHEMDRVGLGEDDRLTDAKLRAIYAEGQQTLATVPETQVPAKQEASSAGTPPYAEPVRRSFVSGAVVDSLPIPSLCPDGKHAEVDVFGDCRRCGWHVHDQKFTVRSE